MEKTLTPKGFLILPRYEIPNVMDKMIFTLLLEKANFIDSAQCIRGELIISTEKFAKETGWTYAQVRGALTRLSKLDLITKIAMPRKKGLRITICNYSYYQDLRNYKINASILNNQENNDEGDTENMEENKHQVFDTSMKSIVTRPMNNDENKQVTISKVNKKDNEKHNTITKYLNEIIVHHLKDKKEKILSDFLELALSSDFIIQNDEQTSTFAEYIKQFNSPVAQLEQNKLNKYLNCIRKSRSSEKINLSKILIFFTDVEKYKMSDIDKAISIHIAHHCFKNEAYTKGILENIRVASDTDNHSINVTEHKIPENIRAREERLRAKGFLSNLQDVVVDY
ncbi:hypothetical protein BKP37_15830 [Anaerobacillus alkalilacustris]|uniref:Uncharacterized protein n=1 Tax=Anaerobacillus alkalilacustris TaxID=393763 RepID=A0A1S2LIP2_9BACI|nr:hypothetical protein [Anaerobacillus alkalilacustris]OIJ11345.1 hypothetical protein BKP37_15830 [Anaerobacillus alkalilacustris]